MSLESYYRDDHSWSYLIRASAIERDCETMHQSQHDIVVGPNLYIGNTLAVGSLPIIFRIDKRYSLKKLIGRGSSGLVISCNDSETNTLVAIKKVTNTFENVFAAKRVLREVMLLKHLRHENIINLIDIIHPRSSVDEFKDVYMVLDLMETDLHRIIQSKQPLTDDHYQFLMVQLLRGLKYIHSAGVVHRDLKPSNILVNSRCDLKICDFGLARGMGEEDVALTEYVVTRWYRAPEVLLSSRRYDFSLDVWSAGCILAELLLGEPMFKGSDYIDQIRIIQDYLGSPSEDDLQFASATAIRFMRDLPHKPQKDFKIKFPKANRYAVDLMEQMLKFNPSKRLSVNDAMKHPFLVDAAAEEISSPATCSSIFEFKYDKVKLDGQMLRELMWFEMTSFHPDTRADWEDFKSAGKLVYDKAIESCEMSNMNVDRSNHGDLDFDQHRNSTRQEDTSVLVNKKLKLVQSIDDTTKVTSLQ